MQASATDVVSVATDNIAAVQAEKIGKVFRRMEKPPVFAAQDTAYDRKSDLLPEVKYA
ncbi:hypothetical protein RBU00_01140 [Rhizobium sp. AN63]|uniref:hypothetical protein n=1 Tax=Rhizobium sp. AN63 TaxID=3035210 RepID=UPI0027D42050|nr:hypothetical protein [Rhizobium sp. AN63]MDQ4405118.1 hypothetical protein [Rhizobium sp. AN63]